MMQAVEINGKKYEFQESWDILEEKTVTIDGKKYVPEEDAYDAVDLAHRETAEEITKKKDLNEILHYCYGIMDF